MTQIYVAIFFSKLKVLPLDRREWGQHVYQNISSISKLEVGVFPEFVDCKIKRCAKILLHHPVYIYFTREFQTFPPFVFCYFPYTTISVYDFTHKMPRHCKYLLPTYTEWINVYSARHVEQLNVFGEAPTQAPFTLSIHFNWPYKPNHTAAALFLFSYNKYWHSLGRQVY